MIPEGEAARLEALARRLVGNPKLDGRPLQHVSEAIQYRGLDRAL